MFLPDPENREPIYSKHEKKPRYMWKAQAKSGKDTGFNMPGTIAVTQFALDLPVQISAGWGYNVAVVTPKLLVIM